MVSAKHILFLGLFSVYIMVSSVSLYAEDPTPNINFQPTKQDSISNSQFANDNLDKQMESFYTKAESNKFNKGGGKPAKSKNDEVKGLQNGELVSSIRDAGQNKKRQRQMWGEADFSFEYEEQIRNYEALLKSYRHQLRWAKDVKNERIEDLMNVKITQTKKLIKACKRNLRKY